MREGEDGGAVGGPGSAGAAESAERAREAAGGAPCFSHIHGDGGKLWLALLEKAYAKSHGGYAAIEAEIDVSVALFDLTGIPTFSYNLQNIAISGAQTGDQNAPNPQRDEQWAKLRACYARG